MHFIREATQTILVKPLSIILIPKLLEDAGGFYATKDSAPHCNLTSFIIVRIKLKQAEICAPAPNLTQPKPSLAVHSIPLLLLLYPLTNTPIDIYE